MYDSLKYADTFLSPTCTEFARVLAFFFYLPYLKKLDHLWLVLLLITITLSSIENQFKEITNLKISKTSKMPVK